MKIEIDTVYNIDCLELMREMVRQGIKADWCITDPPYGIGEDGKKNHSRSTKRAPAKQFIAKSWDKQRIGEEYFDLMFQCSKNQLIFGGNYYTDILPPTNNWAVWDKRCSDNQKNDFSDCELAWVSLGGARMFRYLYNGMLQGDMANKDVRFHPTQKPTQLWKKILGYYTKEGDLILDQFMGSFTTAVCCHKMQRHFIGAELDKDYFELGQERYRKETAQMSIFDF